MILQEIEKVFPVASSRVARNRRWGARAALSLIIVVGIAISPFAHWSVAQETSPAAADAKTEPPKESPFPQRAKVPQGMFDGGKEWLNASGPIAVRDLKGKIVIIDFWTYCCINCMHVLPELKAIEEKFPNEVVVIGVHSAKFENEKETENIRRAIQRYEIAHPVVNDAEMVIWDRFGARAWPTLAFIDPEGFYLGAASGEVPREALEGIVDQLIAYHKNKGTLDTTPVQFQLERDKLAATPLRFPGKVLADEAGNRLFISDSNHNRIVISSLDGKLIDVIGNGKQGAADGAYDQATFNHPQGTALVGDTLYVADTENHLIRTVDLKTNSVATLAGTGKQARREVGNGKLRETALNSPWAAVELDGVLYIAMAGAHQIWHHKLGSDSIQAFAGSGAEDIIDGPAPAAAFAQPSDIVTDGRLLYVNDSEGSSIRKISVGPAPEVATVVGTAHLESGRLFAFGDVDGMPPRVRFQHPIGLAFHEGALYVADSYNHKIRKVSAVKAAGKTTSILGNGKPGDRIDPPQLHEPEGLAVARGKLYVADTNNHRIAVMDLGTSAFSILTIDGLAPPPAPESDDSPQPTTEPATVVERQSVAAGESLTFQVALLLPKGYKLNALGPLVYQLSAEKGQTLLADDVLGKRSKATAEGTTATVTVPLSAKTGAATVDLSLTYGYCRDGVGGLCKINTDRWSIPVELSSADAQTVIKLTSDARQPSDAAK